MKKSKKTAIFLGAVILLAFITMGSYWLFKGPSEEEKKGLSKELLSYIEQDELDKVTVFVEEHPEIIDYDNVYGKTPLQMAFEGQKTAIAKLLIEKGATTKEEPMLLAVSHTMLDGVHIQAWAEEDQKEYAALFELLIKKSEQDMQLKDDEGNTPMHLAAFKGVSIIVDVLLNHEAKVDVENKEGYNPLQAAVIRGDAETVKKIAETDPDLIAKSNETKPLLILAVENGRTELYEYLIKEQPNSISLKNSDGKTAMDIAKAYNDQETIKILEKQ